MERHENSCWRIGNLKDGIGPEERTSNNVNASVQRSLAIQAIPAVEAEPTRMLCTYPG